MLEVVGANNLIVVAFNPNGERDARTINIQSNDEYRDFVLGICKRMALKKLPKGKVICHKGDIGKEMYIILHGKVGVFLEKTSADISKNRQEVLGLYTQIKGTLDKVCTKETILKMVEFENKKRITEILEIFSPEEKEILIVLLTYFETVGSWPKEMLYLLASEKPQQYLQNLAFCYWMAAAVKAGGVIGEQALLNRTPRNATLLTLSRSELLILDKESFDSYLGAAAEQQEERVEFFLKCFPSISRRSINNFQCMFHKSTKMRGEVIAKGGRPLIEYRRPCYSLFCG